MVIQPKYACTSTSCGINNKCQNNATCHLLNKFNYTCSCSKKYHGQLCQFENACFDNPCQHNSTCIKTLNTSRCECQMGYSGELCQNEEPCYFNPCQHNGTCHINGNNSTNYTCQCRSGYSGAYCQILDTKDKESPGLGVGYIILIVVLIVLILGGLIGLVIYFKRRDRQGHIPLVETNMVD